MLNRFLLCTGLLIPSAAFAADQAPGDPSDGAEKHMCDVIGPDWAKCAAASRYCFWDPVDNRCEALNPGFTSCGGYGVPAPCDADPSCFWDPVDNRCEPLH